jgi:hypothetical protein
LIGGPEVVDRFPDPYDAGLELHARYGRPGAVAKHRAVDRGAEEGYVVLPQIALLRGNEVCQGRLVGRVPPQAVEVLVAAERIAQEAGVKPGLSDRGIEHCPARDDADLRIGERVKRATGLEQRGTVAAEHFVGLDETGLDVLDIVEQTQWFGVGHRSMVGCVHRRPVHPDPHGVGPDALQDRYPDRHSLSRLTA